MDNLISTCYVIESKDIGLEPIIYLRRPDVNPFGNEQLFTFPNPFAAKAFIRKTLGVDADVYVLKMKNVHYLSANKLEIK